MRRFCVFDGKEIPPERLTKRFIAKVRFCSDACRVAERDERKLANKQYKLRGLICPMCGRTGRRKKQDAPNPRVETVSVGAV